MIECDILVVGFGPSGATIANLLGKRGYTVAVVEQAAEIYDKPRAITADQEVMRIFQACGLAEEIEKTTTPHPGTDFVGVEGQVIKRFYPAPPPNPLAWEPTWMFVQPELEATLREGVKRFSNVRVFLEHEFLNFIPNDDGVHATVECLATNKNIEFRSKYMIASDGSRSTVRRQIGSQIEDLAFDEWWIVVDAWIRGSVELPSRCIQYCRPSRPGTYIVGPDNLRRWEIKLLPGETPEDFQNEASILKVLSTFVDVSQLELCRTAIYRFHALVAENWKSGRVFLMGDAAHQTPPFLGQGLCAGIRDAINLAWKIDGVERLGYTASLLDSYEEERKPHVRTIVAHAKNFGIIIGELDLNAAKKRDVELGELLASGKAETVRQKFIPDLTTGVITKNKTGFNAGRLFIQPWVLWGGQSNRLDDLVSPGFLVISSLSEVSQWMDENLRNDLKKIDAKSLLLTRESVVNADFDLCLQERDGLFDKWMLELNAKVVVVRPDKYVFGTALNAGELKELISEVKLALIA